jgi:hypothetical protein
MMGKFAQQILGELSEIEGLVICVEGATPTPYNQHGRIHKSYRDLEKAIGLAGKPPGTASLFELEAAGAKAASKVTGCKTADLMAQLRVYHQAKGMGPDFKVRAYEKPSALTNGLQFDSFGAKSGAGNL